MNGAASNSESGPMVVVEQLSQRVTTAGGLLTILDRISLTIERGESVAVVGASGSGKSTLLGLLAGLDRPTEGEIVIAGTPLSRLDEEGCSALRARLIGFVFQSFQLLPGLTALENVMLPLELADHPAPLQPARTLLERVGLADRLDHYPAQLSGGEQQRVAIARAFVVEPALLLADEPTGNLDSRTGEAVIDLIFDLNREHGTTLVLVTHDATLAGRCQRRIELHAGRVA